MVRAKKKRVVVVDFTQEEKPSQEQSEQIENPNSTKVSQSRIKAWRSCKRQHYYKFVEKIQKKRAPQALYKGKIIHELIEYWINGLDWRERMEEHLQEFDKLFEEEKIEYGDLRHELPIIMEGYFKRWENDNLEFLEKDGKKAEHEFTIPLDGKPFNESELYYKGKIDAVTRDEFGRVWLMEHKSFKKLPDEDFRFINQQGTLYTWVMPQIGFPEPTGVLWDYIRTKVPTVPRVLKNGELSRAKIDTTPEVYLQAIKDNGLDPKDYEDILLDLEGNQDNFYRRIYLPTRKTIIQPVVNDLKETALEIKHLGEITKARNLGRHCSYCEFKSLCQAEIQGLDVEFIKKTEYEPSTYHLTAEEGSDGEEDS